MIEKPSKFEEKKTNTIADRVSHCMNVAKLHNKHVYSHVSKYQLVLLVHISNIEQSMVFWYFFKLISTQYEN